MLAEQGNTDAAARLEGPPVPDGAEYLWEIFNDVSAGRGSNGFGPNPISYSEWEAYQRMTGLRLSMDELTVLRALDRAFLAYVALRRATG